MTFSAIHPKLKSFGLWKTRQIVLHFGNQLVPVGILLLLRSTGEGSCVQRQETDPNSVLLLRAGQTPHCVTSLRRGRRIVLKCAFATTDAIYNNDAMLVNNNQFGIARSAKVGSKKRVRGKTRGR